MAGEDVAKEKAHVQLWPRGCVLTLRDSWGWPGPSLEACFPFSVTWGGDRRFYLALLYFSGRLSLCVCTRQCVYFPLVYVCGEEDEAEVNDDVVMVVVVVY